MGRARSDRTGNGPVYRQRRVTASGFVARFIGNLRRKTVNPGSKQQILSVFLLGALCTLAVAAEPQSSAIPPPDAGSNKLATPAPASAIERVSPEKLREDGRIL